QIVFEKQADIVHAVAQHRQALDAHAKGVTGPALAINARGLEDIGMYDAAAKHFEPACLLANTAAGSVAEQAFDVDLGRRLGEGEIGGTKANAELALEEPFHEAVQRGFEIREAYVLIDHEPLDLVKHRRVGYVRVAAIDTSRRDHTQRRR